MLLETLKIKSREGRKTWFVLADPDKPPGQGWKNYGEECLEAGAEAILVGGSVLTGPGMGNCVGELKKAGIRVCLFPGSPFQIDSHADSILFLSLISGRNPELLIGHHVHAAPIIKKSGMEVIPTGYILTDSGKMTAAHYMSGTQGIPHDKPEIAASTALAGEMLGMKCIYIDSGSGALKPVSSEMLKAIRKQVRIPLIVGGGIKTAEDAERIFHAGADAIVVGTAFENSDSEELKKYLRGVSSAKRTGDVPG